MPLKHVLITGTSSGIGLSTAKLLIQEGHTVMGISRNLSPELEKLSSYHHLKLDLSKPKDLEKNAQKTLKNIQALDAIICNAGIGRFGKLEEFSYFQMEKILNVNFLSHAYLIKLLLPTLKRQKAGDIIFIGSEAALQGKKKGTMYCASKFALRGFAQALKEECVSSHIRVSMIQPGMTKTSFFDALAFEPADRSHLSADDVAKIVLMILQAEEHILFEEIVLAPLKKELQWKHRMEKSI